MTSVLWATTLGDAVFAAFMAILVVGWLLLLGLMLFDMFRDPSLSGWAKLGWITLMVILPLIGIFAYLLARGDVVGRRIGADRASRATDGPHAGSDPS